MGMDCYDFKIHVLTCCACAPFYSLYVLLVELLLLIEEKSVFHFFVFIS